MNDIIIKWNTLTTGQQLDYLRACTVKAAQREIDGNFQHFISFHDLDGLVNAAWLKLTDRMTDSYLEQLNARRAAKGKAEITFNSIVYRAALDAVRTARRGDAKHERQALTVCGEDGSEYDRPVYRHTDSTEVIALGRLILAEFAGSRDEIDRFRQGRLHGTRGGTSNRHIRAGNYQTTEKASRRLACGSSVSQVLKAQYIRLTYRPDGEIG